MALRDVLKVLVIDDMSTSRGLLLQALDAFGILHVDYAEDGEAGLSAARQKPPHLVLCDLYMPGLNGLEVLQRMRADPVTREAAFILISGRGDASVLRAGKRLGLNNFIEKPFDLPRLKAGIEAVVGRL